MQEMTSHFLFRKRHLLWVGAMIACLALLPYSESSAGDKADTALPDQYAHLSGMAFVTDDLDASVNFYVRFLGFVERRRVTLDTIETSALFGTSEGTPVTYAALVPAEWSKEAPHFPGLNFAQTEDTTASPFPVDADRLPIASELVMAMQVVNLEKIEREMRAARVTVVVPLSPSATGKSLTLTVLDPNGVKLQLYEYLQGD